LQKIGQELIQHGIKPSLIRIKVYDYLKKDKDHPDAEKIFTALRKEIPTLSLTSVYNALKVLTKNKLIREIMIEEDEIRYDGFIEQHAHFKCIKCKKIFDVNLKYKNYLKFDELKKAKILDEHIYFIGICENCLNKEIVEHDRKNKR